jgi:hypothetical protein
MSLFLSDVNEPFEKYLHIKFHENPSSGMRVASRGRTDIQAEGGWSVMTQLIVAFAILRKRLKTEKYSWKQS